MQIIMKKDDGSIVATFDNIDPRIATTESGALELAGLVNRIVAALAAAAGEGVQS